MPPSRLVTDESPVGAIAGWLDRFGIIASFVWGVSEAILFFVVPDVIVGAVALFVPRDWWKAVTAAIAGALVGGVVLFSIVAATGDGARDIIDAVPGIPASMIEQVQEDLTEHGGSALVLAPLSGVPYKVYVTEMALRSWNLLSVVLWSIPARGLRIIPAGLGAVLVGLAARRWVRRWPGRAVAVYLLAWVVVYVFYFGANGL